MRKTSLLMVFCMSYLFIQGQEPKQALFGAEYNFDHLKNDTTNALGQNFHAFVNFPIVRKDSSLGGGRVRYQGSQLKDIDSIFNRSLTQIDVNLFWQKIRPKGTKFYLFAQLGVYSDFKDISGKDICFRVGTTYTFKHSDKLKTGWGIGYAKQFFGHQISPFISIDYTINKKLKLSGLLPIRPKLTYTINEKMSWVNEIAGNVESYRLSASSSDNSFITSSGWFGTTSFGLVVRKHHCLSAGIGYTFRQNTQFYEDSGSSNWKLFTINLSEKNQEIYGIKTSGIRCTIKYSFVLR